MVTRHPGGIKLGKGGLVRAYAGCVKLAMQQLPITLVAKVNPQLTCVYHQQNVVDRLIRQFNVDIVHADFSTGVYCELKLNATDRQDFIHFVNQPCLGQIINQDIDNAYGSS